MCFKLGLRAGGPVMPAPLLTAAVRPGVYLRVATTGTLAAGDPIDVVGRPAHGSHRVRGVRDRHHERDRAARLLEVPELPSATTAGPAIASPAGDRGGSLDVNARRWPPG